MSGIEEPVQPLPVPQKTCVDAGIELGGESIQGPDRYAVNAAPLDPPDDAP